MTDTKASSSRIDDDLSLCLFYYAVPSSSIAPLSLHHRYFSLDTLAKPRGLKKERLAESATAELEIEASSLPDLDLNGAEISVETTFTTIVV